MKKERDAQREALDSVDKDGFCVIGEKRYRRSERSDRRSRRSSDVKDVITVSTLGLNNNSKLEGAGQDAAGGFDPYSMEEFKVGGVDDGKAGAVVSSFQTSDSLL